MSNCNSYIKSNKINIPSNKLNDQVQPGVNANNVRCFTSKDMTSVKQDADYINYDIDLSQTRLFAQVYNTANAKAVVEACRN